MRIFIVDTEFLSWKKDQSDKSPYKRKLNQPAEIIQIFIKEIFSDFKNEKLLFIKPKNFKNYPYRISQITGIKKKYLDTNGEDFKLSYEKLVNFLPTNALVISNGDEYKIINHNIQINNIKKKFKKIKFLNFYHLIKNNKLFLRYKKSNHISISDIKKTLKIRFKNHNAKNDVQILIECIKKININKLDFKKFYKFYNLRKI